jgi:hypothetical protein
MSNMFDLSMYETVDQRLEKFWAKYPDGAILTELVAYKDDRFIFKASVYKTYADNVPFATGYAEESVSNRGVNSTSALENSESSAIGRALHTGGISKHSEGKPRPSAEEMAKVKAKQEKPEPTTFKEKLADKITMPVEDDPWSTKAVSPAPSAAEAIELVQEVLGAVKIDKDIPLCRNCHDHKPMQWKTGVSAKNNKPWGKFDCYVCRDVIWYNIAADGTWKPQEAKA